MTSNLPSFTKPNLGFSQQESCGCRWSAYQRGSGCRLVKNGSTRAIPVLHLMDILTSMITVVGNANRLRNIDIRPDYQRESGVQVLTEVSEHKSQLQLVRP